MDKINDEYNLEALRGEVLKERRRSSCREALTNVARHAEAHKATLQVGNTAGHYYVSVQDDGHGFDATQPGPSGHFGLQIMKSRAMLVGGQLEVESAPGRGTRVTLIWPMGKDG